VAVPVVDRTVEPAVEAEPEPATPAEADLGPAATVEPERPVEEPEPDIPEPAARDSAEPTLDPERAQEILDQMLEALGSAHHRPFSRG
jgi:hypothetical protein